MAQRGRGLADAARRAVGRAAKAVRGQEEEAAGDGHAGKNASGAASAAKRAPGKKSAPPGKSAPAEKSATAKKAAPAKRAAAKKTEPVKKADPGKRAQAVKKGAPAKEPAAKQPAATKSATRKSGTKKPAPARKSPPAKATTKATSKTATTKKATTTNATPAQSKPAAKATSRRHKPPAASIQVGSNEKPWSEQELAAIREELEHDLQTMLSELALSDEQIAELIQDASNASGDDPADTGSKAFEREHEMTLANNTRELIRQTRRALGRIAAGSYGTCESCGNAIGKRRLQAFPRATLCVSCKQEQERR